MNIFTDKLCAKCKTWKNKDDFSKNKNDKSGLQSQCKACIKEYNQSNRDKISDQKREYRQNNKEKMSARDRAYRGKNNREKINANTRKYRKSHREKITAQDRKYKQTHREAIKATQKKDRNIEKRRAQARKYKLNHPEKSQEHKQSHRDEYRLYEQNRRARLVGNGGMITKQEWQWLKEFYEYKCLACGRCETDIKLTLDHVLPLNKGGKNIIENAQPLCQSCNSSKGTKDTDYRSKKDLFL